MTIVSPLLSSLRALILFTFALDFGGNLHAQPKPFQPDEVPLGVRVKLRADGGYYMQAGKVLASGSAPLILDVAYFNANNRSVVTDSPNLAFRLIPGQEYFLNFSCASYDWADLQFDVPAGYTLYAGRPYYPKSPRSSYRAQTSIVTSVALELRPNDDAASQLVGYARAPGFRTNASLSGVTWAVSVGALANGRWAGALRWWQKSFDASLLSNASLAYDTPVAQGALSTHYTDGSLKYIDTWNAQIVVERNSGANSGYKLKFFRADATISYAGNGDGDAVPQANQEPYITYNVTNPNGTTWSETAGLEIVRTETYKDDSNADAIRTDVWKLHRDVSGNCIVNEAAGTRQTTVVRTGGPASNQYTETTTIGTVSKIRRVMQEFSWGWETVSETNDPEGLALTTLYEYYNGTWSYYAPPTTTGAVWQEGSDATVGKLKRVSRPDGSWELYTYYTDQERYGQLKEVVRPWKDAVNETAGPLVQTVTYGYATETIVSGLSGILPILMPQSSFKTTPAGSVTTVGSTVVARTFAAPPTATADSATGNRLPLFDPVAIDLNADYRYDISGDAPITNQEIRAYSAESSYLATTKRSFAAWAHPLHGGKLYSQINPDGTKVSASYITGSFVDKTDNADWATTGFAYDVNGTSRCDTFLFGLKESNPAVGTVEYSTDGISGRVIDTVWLVPNQSKRQQTFYNSKGQAVIDATYVFLGSSSFQLISWEKRTYTDDGLVATRQNEKGELWSAVYHGGRMRSETKPDGTVTKYSRNALGQVTSSYSAGVAAESGSWDAQPEITTAYTVDILGRTTAKTDSPTGGGLSLTESRIFNLAGLLESETAVTGLVTGYAYTNSGRTVTQTLPGGSTIIMNRYRDGTTYAKTGTGTVAEYSTYREVTASGVESGFITARKFQSVDNGARYEQTVTDWLGRAKRLEKPAFSGDVFQKTWSYNSKGQLAKTTETNLAATLYTYTPMGEPFQTCLDLNNDDILDFDGMDRITQVENSVVPQSDGSWWRQRLTKVYNQDNNGTAKLQTEKLEKLVPYPYASASYSGGAVRSEARGYDIFRNLTVTTTATDRAARLTTVTTDHSDSTTDEISWVRNGFIQKKQSAQNLTTDFYYDSLRRLVKQTDPRSDTSSTPRIGYHTSGTGQIGQVAWRDDSAGNRTTFTYQGDTGRLAWSTDPLTKITYHTYTTRGEPMRDWGSATYPVEYEYNDYGERTKMRTWRTHGSDVTAIGWGGLTYPSTTGDLTTWTYEAATGLLLSKKDADDKSVTYTYNPRGQLATRAWARGVTTTYRYAGDGSNTLPEAKTGEQRRIEYSDSATHFIEYAYNRLGQNTSVTDVTGTRIIDHCVCGKVVGETLPAYFDGRKLTYQLDSTTTGALGRTTGFRLSGPSATGTDYAVTYGYDSYGRFNSFASPSGLATTYTYTPNSNLVATIGNTSGYTETMTYESNRDLLATITGTYAGASKAAFAYGHDALGRRDSVVESGEIFSFYQNGGLITKWGYNDRSEVTSAQSYFGQNLADLSAPVPARNLGYDFDHIGNRKTASIDGTAHAYTSNALNQYTATTRYPATKVTGFSPAAVTVNATPAGGTTTTTTAASTGYFYHQSVGYASSTAGGYLGLALTSTYAGSTTTINRDAWLPPSPQAYAYDLDGNLTDDDRWHYTWDAENRLTSMETLGRTASPGSYARWVWDSGAPRQYLSFVYDYLGRRVQKTVANWNGSAYVAAVDRKFIYDGWNLIAEHNVLVSGTPAVARYAWGLDLSKTLQDGGGVGGLLAIFDVATAAAHFPAYDGNGNIHALVSRTNGAVTAAYEYDAFGQTLRATGSFADKNPFRFSTKYTDGETGLLYYGRRYYNPTLGRWLGRDPIEEKGGLHLYGFVGNNGVNRWDLLGMEGSMYADGSGSNDPGAKMSTQGMTLAGRVMAGMAAQGAGADSISEIMNEAETNLANVLIAINEILGGSIQTASGNLTASNESSLNGLLTNSGASIVASGNAILNNISNNLNAGVSTYNSATTNQLLAGFTLGSVSIGTLGSAASGASTSGYSDADIAATSARNTQQQALNLSNGTSAWGDIVNSLRQNTGAFNGAADLANTVPYVAVAPILLAEFVVPSAAAAVKNTHIDGPKLSPNALHGGVPTGRVFQVRIGNTPVFRIDYTDLPDYKAKPILHAHVWPIMDVHIRLQPKK